MSLFSHAQNTFVQGDITATQINGNAYNAEVTNVVTQHTYHVASLKGIDLLHQRTSPAALLDSSARRDPPRCMEGTREAIIQEILDWLKKLTNSSSILWLRGPAGHGKTALEFTIAEICKREGLLIGSFFFSNRIANCSDGSLLFSTLVAQLIKAIPSTKDYIDKAIRKDPHIFDKSPETQMKALIVEPIQRIATMVRVIDIVTFGRKSYPKLIVIDGLDECAGIDVQDEIIRIIGDLVQILRLPLRFLIASRPEPNICEAFEKLQSRLSRNSLSTLLLTEDALTRRDIQIYFERKFNEIRARHSYLPAEWPGPEIIMRLVDKASGQFVYATTVVIYISSPDDRPDDRLDVILKLLETPAGDAPYAPLDQLYSYIVRSVKHRAEVLLILGQLILAQEISDDRDILMLLSNSTSSQRRVEVILNLRVGDVKRLLNSLHSVIDVGDDLKLLHASFQDFLLDPSRSKDFFVNIPEARTMLGLAYIRMICGTPSIFAISIGSGPTILIRSCMHKALQYCAGAGLFEKFSEGLHNADIIGEYVLYVCAAPWKRSPATVALNEICEVLTDHGYGDFDKLSIDKRLNAPEARTMLGLAYIQAICGPPSIFEIFTDSGPNRECKPDMSPMHEALECCAAAGLLEQLYEKLNGTDIIGQYEVYVRVAPWKRYPATLVLKHFCALLTESGYARFDEPDIDARLKAFWDTFTWAVVENSKAAGRGGRAILKIRLWDRPSFASAMEFLVDLSNRKLPHLCRKDQTTKHLVFMSPDSDNVLIRFDLGSHFVKKSVDHIIGFSFGHEKSEDDALKIPHLRGPGGEGEVLAWHMLAMACYERYQAMAEPLSNETWRRENLKDAISTPLISAVRFISQETSSQRGARSNHPHVNGRELFALLGMEHHSLPSTSGVLLDEYEWHDDLSGSG